MSYRENNFILLEKNSINLKTTGNGTLFSSPNKTVIPVRSVIIIETATSVTTVPTISLGTNASSYNNILAATSLTSMNAANMFSVFTTPTSGFSTIPANTFIYINITVAGISSGSYRATVLMEFYPCP